MNKDSITDYLAYILLKSLGPLFRHLPFNSVLFIGRRLGELFYCFDLRHRRVAYSNIRRALGDKYPPSKLKSMTRDFYRAFGQNIMEIFLIPKVGKAYINKYVKIEGFENVAKAFGRGKGVIFLGVHEGSWELSNIICANLGFNFSIFVRNQKFPLLDKLLNAYRVQKGCRLIQRENQTRRLIQELKSNNSMGITLDQGGKSGVLVKFFGKNASMSTGALRLALKYDAAILPAFYTRIKGPYIKVIVDKPFAVKRTQDPESDLRDNLQELTRVFEKNILSYPQEYLWTYKTWKYGNERELLILSDGKTGHLRQSQALAGIVSGYFKDKGVTVNIQTQEVKFKSNLFARALAFGTMLCGRLSCQGCLRCLKLSLDKDVYRALIKAKPDVVVSCGSALAPVNLLFSRENSSKSIVIMRPSILSMNRFDLVVMPLHDQPPKRKNIAVTQGALNLIDEDYLQEQAQKLNQVSGIPAAGGSAYGGRPQVSDLSIGLLIGGDARGFKLDAVLIKNAIGQIKKTVEKIDAQILVTTSRRTPVEVERLAKDEFKDYPRCKFLVIANEKNVPQALGGILALSDIIIASPESISMISEAVMSKKYVLVFEAPGLDKKHRRFLANFSDKGYIYLSGTQELSGRLQDLWSRKPPVKVLDDNAVVLEAIRKII